MHRGNRVSCRPTDITTLSVFFLVMFTTPVAPAATCQIGRTSSFGRSHGVAYLRTSFREPEEQVGATVLRPDAKKMVPGVVISYSAVTSEKKAADMLQFALALARAGAASIVLDDTLALPTSEHDDERTHRLVECASEWLVQNASVDGERVAAIAPENFWKGWSSDTFCSSDGQPCWTLRGGVGFPQLALERLVSDDVISSADFLHTLLNLEEIRPEWLTDVVVTVPQSAAKQLRR